MPTHCASHLLLAIPLLGVPLFAACTGTPSKDAAAAAQAAEEARARRAAEDWVRALVPELGADGAITRESLERALLSAAPAAPAPDATREEEVPVAAIQAIRRGDYATARGLLGELVARNEVARARELVAAHDLRGALAVLDRAVATAPDSPELHSMRGEVALALAAESGDSSFARAALEDFEEAMRKRGGPRAIVGASRAARALGQGDKALEYARAGLSALDGADFEIATARGRVHAERVWAEASLDTWSRGPKDAPLAKQEAAAALEASIGRAPEDAWAWQQLARFALDAGDGVAARRTAARGLDFFPEDAELHASLAAALRKTGGEDAVVLEYERFLALHPRVAIAWREVGEARYRSALDALSKGHGDAAAFARAEADFARCRATITTGSSSPTSTSGAASATLAAECSAREALCRTGTGHVLLAAGDLDGARAAFLSVEDASKGGLALGDPPRLSAAIDGLDEVASAYVAASRSQSGGAASIEALERAARIHDYLHEYAPNEVRFAVAAARESSEAAKAVETDARTLASQGKVDEANRRLVLARELMEKSREAYTDAVALAPEDALVAKEAGTVLVKYLQRDADTARAWLEKAARIGEARRDALKAGMTGVDAAQRRALASDVEVVESALGDAYQCLGVLYLDLEGDPVRALEWFQKSLKGPDPREDVSGKGGLIERCEEAIRIGQSTRLRDEQRWAAPVPSSKKQNP